MLRLNGGIWTAIFAAFVLTVAAPAEAQRTIPVNIESVPPGATVFLDSTSSPPLGTTPLSNVRVPIGSHTIIFRLLNHEEARLSVNVRRRRETFRAVLRALATIEVSAGNEGARGATVQVNGQTVGGGPLGGTPIRVTDLQPGRHQVRVEREGYRPFEQWVEVGGGQVVRVGAMLERAAPDTGSILVSGPPGAPVFLDGEPRGVVPTVIDDVPVGQRTVEIRPPGQQPHVQQVAVLAGQRVTVTMQAPSGGSVRVIANAPGAIISVDGEAVGPSPATRENLAPGEHIVSATAEGYEPIQQTVTIEAGQQRVVSLELSRVAGAAGRIVVRANVDGAAVLVDNEERGQAPVVLTPEPGVHAIVVRADGHQDFSTTCETGPGQNCEVDATLVPQQVRVRIAVQPGLRDGQLLVDGEPAGPVPFDGTLPAGSHVIEVQAPGYETYRQQVLLTPSSEVRPFDVTLARITDGLSEDERVALREEEERFRQSAVTHSASPLPVNQASFDVSLGWPYLGEVRANIGVYEIDPTAGIDVGFALRSFGRLTDFEGRVRVGWRPIEQLAIAGQVRFGGGIGPELGHRQPRNPPGEMRDMDNGYNVGPITQEADPSLGYPVNSAFLSLEAIGSLNLDRYGAVSLWLGLDLSSDEYAGHPVNAGAWLDFNREGERVCMVEGTGSGATLNCPREDWGRLRLGGALELVLTRNWNVWFILEGILTGQPRRIFGNLLGIEANDTQLYLRLGFTYKD